MQNLAPFDVFNPDEISFLISLALSVSPLPVFEPPFTGKTFCRMVADLLVKSSSGSLSTRDFLMGGLVGLDGPDDLGGELGALSCLPLALFFEVIEAIFYSD